MTQGSRCLAVTPRRLPQEQDPGQESLDTILPKAQGLQLEELAWSSLFSETWRAKGGSRAWLQLWKSRALLFRSTCYILGILVHLLV